MSAGLNPNYPTWGDTIKATDKVFCPTEWIRQSAPYGWLHRHTSVGAKILITPLAFVDGALKVIVFPALAVIGVVVFPIFAMIEGGIAGFYKAIGNSEKAAKHFARASLGWKMTVVSIGAVGGLVGVVFLTVYVLPMWMPVAATFGSVGLSVGITVYRVWHHTPFKNDPPKQIGVELDSSTVADEL